MTAPAPARLTRRRVRDGQRAVRLVAGVVLTGYIYFGPVLGAGFTAAVQWVVVPVMVGSRVALWKWPRIRAMLRRGRR